MAYRQTAAFPLVMLTAPHTHSDTRTAQNAKLRVMIRFTHTYSYTEPPFLPDAAHFSMNFANNILYIISYIRLCPSPTHVRELFIAS